MFAYKEQISKSEIKDTFQIAPTLYLREAKSACLLVSWSVTIITLFYHLKEKRENNNFYYPKWQFYLNLKNNLTKMLNSLKNGGKYWILIWRIALMTSYTFEFLLIYMLFRCQFHQHFKCAVFIRKYFFAKM